MLFSMLFSMLLLLVGTLRPCGADTPGHATGLDVQAAHIQAAHIQAAHIQAEDAAAIRQILHTYETSWNRHDAHAFSLIFAPEAQFVNVRAIAYPGGRAGIERAHRPLFEAMFKESHVTTDRMQIWFLRPDVATADVYWRMMGARDRSGRLRGLVRGLRNMVLTKAHQRWEITVFHNMEISEMGIDVPASGGTPPEKVIPSPNPAPNPVR